MYAPPAMIIITVIVIVTGSYSCATRGNRARGFSTKFSSHYREKLSYTLLAIVYVSFNDLAVIIDCVIICHIDCDQRDASGIHSSETPNSFTDALCQWLMLISGYNHSYYIVGCAVCCSN